jgi:hypothetical protein
LFLVAVATLGAPALARAQQLGPHFGVNLDGGSIHLGGDLLLPLSQLSEQTRADLRVSAAHVFIDGGHDVELLGCDFPFELDLQNTIVTPYAAPGVGLAIGDKAWLKVNLIGGAFFDVSPSIRLWSELAIRLVNGTFVDLLGGVLFEL